MKPLSYYNWKMWEYILIGTEWLFGPGHAASHGVKHNRNMAYIKHTFRKRKSNDK